MESYMKIRSKLIGGTALAALSITSIAHAQSLTDGLYIGASYGFADTDDISTDGKFTSDFTTGTVTGVNPPLTVPAGESVKWNTKLDDGEAYSFVFGKQFGMFRAELEYTATNNDVDKHSGVTAAGINLDAIDAGVLLTGNVGDLGVSVGDLVANGQGEVETSAWLVNGYYDFKNSTAFTPFLGGGVGMANVDIEYKPSNVGIINDDDDVFVWQVMGGVSYSFTDQFHLVGSLRYRETDEASVKSDLLPAKFDIETETLVYDIGVRYSF